MTTRKGLHALVGCVLAEKYTLERLIEANTYGAVFEGADTSLGGKVAIKILSPLHADDEFSRRLRREAEALSHLHHPNIVGVQDCGQDQGVEFLAMDFVAGRPLWGLMKQGVVPWRRAIAIVRQVAAALAEAHGHGIIHRDLKPGNVMLVDYPGLADHVEVVDFGIAKALDDSDLGPENDVATRQGGLLGTPRYMSPEQCRGVAVDGRSDIYSLGVLLYQMLCGRPPFHADTDVGVIGRHLHSPVPALPVVPGNTDLPDVLAVLVGQMLAKSPDERPQTAEEVAAALDTLLDVPTFNAERGGIGREAALSESGPLDLALDTLRGLTRSKPRPRVLAVAGLAGALCAGLLLVVAGGGDRSPVPANEAHAASEAAPPRPGAPGAPGAPGTGTAVSAEDALEAWRFEEEGETDPRDLPGVEALRGLEPPGDDKRKRKRRKKRKLRSGGLLLDPRL